MKLFSIYGCVFLIALLSTCLNIQAQVSSDALQEGSVISGEAIDESEIVDALDLPLAQIHSRMRAVYNLIDTDHDSILTNAELLAWMNLLAPKIQQRSLHVEMEMVDTDQDGKVTLEEFIALHSQYNDETTSPELNHSPDELAQLFGDLDLNKDGSLDISEYKQYLQPDRNEKSIQQEVDEIIEAHDSDSDKKISFDEFVKLAKTSDGGAEQPTPSDELLKEEFKGFDLNSDGYIDEAEIRETLPESNPSASGLDFDTEEGLQQAIDEIYTHISGAEKKKDDAIERKGIQLTDLENNLTYLSISVLTDLGEVLRFPKEYGLEKEFDNVDGGVVAQSNKGDRSEL